MVLNVTSTIMDLAHAAKEKNIPLVRRHLRSGSIRQQLEYRDEHTGGTALYWMCVSGNYDIVSRLLNLGADVNTLNYIQHTALHAAADLGYTHIARLLLKHAAKTDMQNENGYTPLHLAAYRGVLVEVIHENGYEEIVSFLLNSGADNSIKNNRGFTAYFEALSNGQSSVCSLLQTDPLLDMPAKISLAKTRSSRPGCEHHSKDSLAVDVQSRLKSINLDTMLDQANNNAAHLTYLPPVRSKALDTNHRAKALSMRSDTERSTSFIMPHLEI